jgi:hypothetical protein
MALAQLVDGSPVEIPYRQDVCTDDVCHSYETLLLWTEADRNAVGVFTVVEPSPSEPGTRIVSSSIQMQDGQCVRVVVHEDIQLDDLKAEALARLADKRWRETQTFTYLDETDVPADPAVNIVNSTLSVRDRSGMPAEETQTWKLKSPAGFRSWNYGDILAYGFAIAAHIQACFEREEALAGAVLGASDYAGLTAIDLDAGWPA